MAILIVEKGDRVLGALICECGNEAHIVDIPRELVLRLQGPGEHEIHGEEEDLGIIQFICESGYIQ